MKKIIVLFIILLTNLYAQFDFKISTDKNSYSYGEIITITASITNISDSTITIIAPCFSSMQAEFEFNEYSSILWTQCLTLQEELNFSPNTTRSYVWSIDPQRFGLPDKDGLQRIVGHYFYENLSDTIYISAPLYHGGQLSVGFLIPNDINMISLKDSLDVQVLERIEYQSINSISETWQINGYRLDSLVQELSKDNRFRYVEFNRNINYDKIIVTSVKEHITINDSYRISDAYPNPFNSSSNFYIELPVTENVKIELYNILGEKVKTVYSGILEKNIKHRFQIHSSGLPSGVYYYVVSSPNVYKSKKLIILK